jgi:hypothetical protein
MFKTVRALFLLVILSLVGLTLGQAATEPGTSRCTATILAGCGSPLVSVCEEHGDKETCCLFDRGGDHLCCCDTD